MTGYIGKAKKKKAKKKVKKAKKSSRAKTKTALRSISTSSLHQQVGFHLFFSKSKANPRFVGYGT